MNIKELLASLTLEEKAGQLAQLPPFFFKKEALQEVAGPVQRLKLKEADIFLAGSVLGIGNPQEMMDIQSIYLSKSRHKIPLVFMADIIHGYKTIFPIPLALAGSFSTQNFYKMARASAEEATLSGIHVTFSPMADLVKDPRWGRVMEAYGEDPYLAYHYAYAMTQGYQGKRLKNKDSLAACIKHFAAYGAALAGRDYAQASISLHDFYQIYDAGYRGAVDAGVRMAMTSFIVFEGVPATIHQTLLRKVLRKRMGFKGVTISDYDSIIETVVHRVSKDDQDAVRQALLATVDIEMASGAYIKHIPTLVKAGLIDLDLIDQAVLRVLKLKKDLGLFQNPFKGAHVEKEKTFPLSAPQLQIAKTLADESIVLLKNKNNILPLGNQKIALLGHLSNSGALLGPWSWHGNRTITPSLNSVLKPFIQHEVEDVNAWSESLHQQINTADVFVVMTGEEEKESGEARSKTNPVLSEKTVEFIKQLKTFGKPIVLIVTAGRPLVLTAIVEDVDAILYAYFLGSQAAMSITDTLMGKNNPSAKLTMTFPRRVGQIPISYNHLNTGRPFLGQSFTYTSHYIDESNLPLFTFGDGLSYTTFSFEQFKDVSTLDEVQFSVQVTNTGTRPGYVIVPVYLEAPLAPVALANRQLVGMEKRWLLPQETQTIIIKVDAQFLTYIDASYQRQPLKGTFTFVTGENHSLINLHKEI
ncbi:MAG: glycoside hydrolase family 3 N-terminal domain-containing protein [Bacilli bacterium]